MGAAAGVGVGASRGIEDQDRPLLLHHLAVAEEGDDHAALGRRRDQRGRRRRGRRLLARRRGRGGRLRWRWLRRRLWRRRRRTAAVAARPAVLRVVGDAERDRRRRPLLVRRAGRQARDQRVLPGREPAVERRHVSHVVAGALALRTSGVDGDLDAGVAGAAVQLVPQIEAARRVELARGRRERLGRDRLVGSELLLREAQRHANGRRLALPGFGLDRGVGRVGWRVRLGPAIVGRSPCRCARRHVGRRQRPRRPAGGNRQQPEPAGKPAEQLRREKQRDEQSSRDRVDRREADGATVGRRRERRVDRDRRGAERALGIGDHQRAEARPHLAAGDGERRRDAVLEREAAVDLARRVGAPAASDERHGDHDEAADQRGAQHEPRRGRERRRRDPQRPACEHRAHQQRHEGRGGSRGDERCRRDATGPRPARGALDRVEDQCAGGAFGSGHRASIRSGIARWSNSAGPGV